MLLKSFSFQSLASLITKSLSYYGVKFTNIIWKLDDNELSTSLSGSSVKRTSGDKLRCSSCRKFANLLVYAPAVHPGDCGNFLATNLHVKALQRQGLMELESTCKEYFKHENKIWISGSSSKDRT